MKTRITTIMFVAGLTLCIAGAAHAQPPENAPAPPGQENAPEAAPPSQKASSAPPAEQGKMRGRGEKPMDEDTRILLEEVMIARMSQELALDDEQTVLMVRRFSQFREQMREMRKQRAQTAIEIKALIKQNKEDAAIEEKLRTLSALDEKIIQTRMEAFKAVSTDLTPWQRAKLYLFISEFENDVRGLMQKAREQRRLKDGTGPGAMGHKEPGPKGRGGKGSGELSNQP